MQYYLFEYCWNQNKSKREAEVNKRKKVKWVNTILYRWLRAVSHYSCPVSSSFENLSFSMQRNWLYKRHETVQNFIMKCYTNLAIGEWTFYISIIVPGSPMDWLAKFIPQCNVHILLTFHPNRIIRERWTNCVIRPSILKFFRHPSVVKTIELDQTAVRVFWYKQ